ncbi:unnamed protein product [Rangifer tarandus platyrhynchus]|uniref:Uncharacterized protein n=1 Tax=Rangifer tarandus platyrhynchus TaxID=3082113 RepID=A0ABN8XMG3_RANTA|nr:unnamed protein product [Rangifer tarandus platyrhynchus]
MHTKAFAAETKLLVWTCLSEVPRISAERRPLLHKDSAALKIVLRKQNGVQARWGIGLWRARVVVSSADKAHGIPSRNDCRTEELLCGFPAEATRTPGASPDM